jgi:hypothetical protein
MEIGGEMKEEKGINVLVEQSLRTQQGLNSEIQKSMMQGDLGPIRK